MFDAVKKLRASEREQRGQSSGKESIPKGERSELMTECSSQVAALKCRGLRVGTSLEEVTIRKARKAGVVLVYKARWVRRRRGVRLCNTL